MLVAWSVAFLLAIAPEPAPEVYAVVVGHNGGTTGLAPLRYADDDALRFGLWFGALAPPDHVWVLAEPDEDTRARLSHAGLVLPPRLRSPTRRALAAALAELREALARRDRRREAHVFFAYAGHGLAGRVLLQPEVGREAAITGRELREAVAGLDADRVFLFFDACRSQSLFSGRGQVELGPDLSEEIAQRERHPPTARIGIITATTSEKPAGEMRMLRAGYFSHILLSGLAGGADADGDRRVEFGELAAFVAFNTQALTPQRPWFDPPGGNLHELVIDLRSPKAELVLADELDGHVLVASAPGMPVFVEVQKARGRSLSLALPPGTYRVMRIESASTRKEALTTLGAGSAHQVDGTLLLDGRSAPEGERGIDAPFDPERSGARSPFTPEVVTALTAGYQSGREPALLRPRRHHRVSAGYGLAPAPFALAGLEHGLELGYRYAFAGTSLGARLDIRFSEHVRNGSPFGLRRAGTLLELGAPFDVSDALELAPFAAAGIRAIAQAERGALTSADYLAPTLAAGAVLNLALADHWSVYVGARVEATWVLLDGARQPFFAPHAVVGIGYAP